MQPSNLRSASVRFVRVSGLFFFLFGLLAVILRLVQFLVLGGPPLEELALEGGFLAL